MPDGNQQLEPFTPRERLALVLFGVGAVGWVFNLVKFVAATADPLTGLFIARALGVVFVPLGALMGLFF